MKSISWRNVAELVGIAAIVGSLLFVGLQMKQDRDLARVETLTDQDDTQIEWARLLNENYEFWVRAMDGEELDKTETGRFDTLAGAYFSKRSYLFQRMTLSDGGISPNGVALETANTIESYPGLRDAWNRRISWWQRNGFMPPFDDSVQKYLDELRSGSRDHVSHTTYWVY